MRALLLCLGLLGCDTTRPCAKGTLFLTLRFDGAAANADNLVIAVQLDGGASRDMTFPRQPGASSTLEIDFPNGYPTGSSLYVEVEAQLASATVGGAAQSFTLAAGCTAAELRLGGIAGDLAGAASDLASTDLALKKIGDPCTLGDNCLCVDGYCCDGDCTQECAACDVGGSEGHCVGVTGTPHGSRAACTGTGTACAGSCDGTHLDACAYGTASCGAANCTSGMSQPVGSCSMGMCVAPQTLCPDGLCGATSCVQVVQVVAGVTWSCALLTDGSVRCWGENDGGVLGTDTLVVPSSNVPIRVAGIGVPGVGMATALAAGSHHVCALVGGAAYCWGDNTDGQLGQGNVGGGPHTTPAAVCATGTGGSCVAMSNLTAIFGGGPNSCAIGAGGHLFCWGNNAKGQTGAAAGSPVTNPVEVCAVGGCPMGFLGDVSPIKQAAIGFLHVLALDQAGNVYCWGTNQDGICGLACGVMTTATSVVPNLTVAAQKPIYIATAELTGYAVISDGTTNNNLVRSWGKGTLGERGDDTVVTPCSSPFPVATVCTASGCGTHLTGVSTVGTAYDSACAVLGGAVHCWGANYNDQLGMTTAQDHSSIAIASNLTSGAVEVAGQPYTSAHFCARLQTGMVRCWGANGQGQLGNGSAGPSPSPSPIAPKW